MEGNHHVLDVLIHTYGNCNMKCSFSQKFSQKGTIFKSSCTLWKKGRKLFKINLRVCLTFNCTCACPGKSRQLAPQSLPIDHSLASSDCRLKLPAKVTEVRFFILRCKPLPRPTAAKSNASKEWLQITLYSSDTSERYRTRCYCWKLIE